MSKSKIRNKDDINLIDKIIMFVLVGIVPILVYYLDADVPAEQLAIVNIPTDYFNYIKVNVIIVMAVVILFFRCADIMERLGEFVVVDELKKAFKNPFFFFGFLIVVATVLSFIFSDYKATALHGAMERFESIWVHFSYIIIFSYAITFFKKNDAFKVFTYSILFSTFVVGLIGTVQFLGYQPLNSEFFKTLTHGNYEAVFNNSGSYSTMYNINTSASYSLFMLFVLVLIAIKDGRLPIKLVSLVNVVLLGITLYNSKSEASYIALVAALVFILILCIFTLFIRKKKKEGLILLAVSLIVFFGSIVAITAIPTLNAQVSNKVASALGAESNFSDYEKIDNTFYFYKYNDDYIAITTYADYFEVYENENLLNSYEYETFTSETIPTENFGDFLVAKEILDEYENVFLSIDDAMFYIVAGEEPFLLDKYNLYEFEEAEHIGFEKHLKLFTDRGYIWSRSLPMALDSILIGKGADNFIMEFPNYDYLGRWYSDFPEGILVDKPHNIYFSMWINNGGIYLISFIGICFLVLKDKIKLLINKENANVQYAAVIVYLGAFAGYIVNGMSTDNIVVITMLFWIFLGIGTKVFNKEVVEK
ncbi:MAG: O-antigen ligase family protein [Lachnospirales bacterium]